MLIDLQIPMADLRQFVNSDTGLLARPGWPDPEVGNEHVRRFGGVKTRKRGGVVGWVGENKICEAQKAVQFKQLPTYTTVEGLRVPLRCAFRRLFFDGLAVSKLEIGIRTKVHHKATLYLDRRDTQALIQHVLNIPVTVKIPTSKEVTCELGRIGDPVSRAYMLDTTATRRSLPAKPEDWWVQPGSPLLFIEYEALEDIGLPRYAQSVPLPYTADVQLHFCSIPHGSKQIRAWMLRLPHSGREWSDQDKKDARTLRLYLLRLNAEHECLRTVLKQIETDKLSTARDTEAFHSLQGYFNEATRHINRWEERAEWLVEDREVVQVARLSEDIIGPGERDALLQRLQRTNMRKNISDKLDIYLRKEEDTSERVTTVINIAEMKGDVINRQEKEITMGDKFENIKGSTIVNRSKVENAFNKVQEDFDEETANALLKVAEEIEKSGNKEAAEIFDSFNEELEKPEPKKPVLRSLWTSTVEVLPSVAEVAGAGAKIAALFA